MRACRVIKKTYVSLEYDAIHLTPNTKDKVGVIRRGSHLLVLLYKAATAPSLIQRLYRTISGKEMVLTVKKL